MRQLAEVSVLAIIRNSGLGFATPRGTMEDTEDARRPICLRLRGCQPP